MGYFSQVAAQFRPSPTTADSTSEGSIDDKDAKLESLDHEVRPVHGEDTAGGVARVEAMQAVWGKHGQKFLVLGLVMMMFIFEIDNSTVYNYQTFATSSFKQLSLLAAIQTCQTIVSAVMKPPIAKISDVIGRGETYIFTITCYLLGYILCASSANVNVYAGGAVFYALGQTGTQLNQIIISDISTARWRGFAIGIAYFPFLITPWISAFIVQSVVGEGGIGWRWGIGMFAILTPFCASFIIITLLYYQRKAKKAGIVVTKRYTIFEFCSLIDLGGMILLSGGLAMLLLPICLAALTPSKWKTPWLIALMVLGIVFLIVLVPYEKWVARHPVVPTRYFRNLTIVTACMLAAFDYVGFSVTHTYLYPWIIVVHNFSVRDATFLVYTSGVIQCLSGIVAGLIMYKTRRYKYLTCVGVVIRVVGYGVMMRLRGTNNSTAELFIVQVIQGLGSGMVQTIVIVAAQIAVPHAELAQISALVLLSGFLGSAIGQAIAGGIFTNTMPSHLRAHLPDASEERIKELFNSITGVLPDWGTAERTAINLAYSDVMRDVTIVALAVSAPIIIAAILFPNNRLTDTQNIVEKKDISGRPTEDVTDNAEIEEKK